MGGSLAGLDVLLSRRELTQEQSVVLPTGLLVNSVTVYKVYGVIIVADIDNECIINL